MTHDLDSDRCGVGRCTAPLALVANGVPLCWPHWLACCDAAQPTSVWLARKARKEWRSSIEPTAQAAKDTARKLDEARRNPRVDPPATQPSRRKRRFARPAGKKAVRS